MNRTKEIFVAAFALFSLFFGAGNLILPPLLGFKSGALWWLVALGFCISAVIIPIFGILAHAKLQGTLFDFAKKVSPTFSLVYSLLIYVISASLPSPRTAAVTHEMAIAPFFDISPLTTSIGYFVLVFVFAINRSKILNILGKLLTPAIILILLAIIGITLFSCDFLFGETVFMSPFSDGILEGYQTFDAIGAVVVGGVLIVSINLKNQKATYQEKKVLIRRAAFLAGIALTLIYAGLIITGSVLHSEFDADISRTSLLQGISIASLGNIGNLFLSLLVGLACFTTAVGIVTGTADFIKSRIHNSQNAYIITAIIGCVLGVVMGQLKVDYIIAIALPALMFIYPITIVLILLNVVPERYASSQVFKAVVLTTILFSIPDFLNSIGWEAVLGSLPTYIPLSQFSMGWTVPAVVVFGAINVLERKQ
ncbi:branched-chain amino acid transport system II carrier protein [uncultured Kriegella sp.]|uniref:branched-chain amino acid transport system II carrier protein n=1 Tax=uncultured Kriegella sp. TaxID=1798910 RepID=UPI0030DC9977|tara:strand:- start:260435 stop:261706 length:1272 start_codon:yes stop_codon:yes gene_type:complete